MTEHSVRRFETDSGAQVFQLPLLAFPENFWVYAYLVVSGEYRILVDTGSGFGESNRCLLDGLAQASRMAGIPLAPANLTHVLLTHGHIDHYGGASFLREQTSALFGAHELDAPILSRYEERLLVSARRLGIFLTEAGVAEPRRTKLLAMYRDTKALFRATPIDFTFEASDMMLGPLRFCHVPGHTAGHVLIRVDELVLAGDHILNGITPHMAPEHLTLSTGLAHYLHSLEVAKQWAGDARLTLSGHKTPIENLSARADAIRAAHHARLQQILSLLRTPMTINEISHALFDTVHGYNVLLALEETGAHVEYLYQRGDICIENLPALENDVPQPIRYVCSG